MFVDCFQVKGGVVLSLMTGVSPPPLVIRTTSCERPKLFRP